MAERKNQFQRGMSLPDSKEKKRREDRCVKDVGMHCTLLNGTAGRFVILRNYSAGGIFFESSESIPTGTYIVLRAVCAADLPRIDAPFKGPVYSAKIKDAESCAVFRSHLFARVRRCIRLDADEGTARYGIGAEIQMLGND
jgi:hypothetical protein